MSIRHSLLLSLSLCLLLSTTACRKQTNSGSDRVIISTDRAPEAVGPYSQAVRVGNTLYLSGQVGLVPGTGELAEGGIEAEARRAMQNIRAILNEAGFTFGDVTEVQVYLTDIGDYSTFNEIYASRFGENPPARAVVEVSALPIGALVEIKMTAVKTE